MIRRSSDFEFVPGTEDLIVMKAFANRSRDWVDIEGIAARQDGLDWKVIREDLKPLVELKGEPDIAERLDRIRRQAGH